MKKYLSIPLFLALTGCSAHIEMVDHVSRIGQPKVIYVNTQQTEKADGTSWQRAYPALNEALAVAMNGDEIHIARGIYLPSAIGDRNASFHLKKGVKLYGGFAGTEETPAERDVKNNPTILSGNIGDPDSTADDSFFVVTGAGENQLDGIEVRDLKDWRDAAWDRKSHGSALHNLYSTDENRREEMLKEYSRRTVSPSKKSAKRDVVFVDAAATPDGDGTSWKKAFAQLQKGIDTASRNGAEVWVAKGLYLPASDNRTATFLVPDGVKIYGSMQAGVKSRKEANAVTTPTILSGNIGSPFLREDNCYHVVTAGNRVTLDGVRITLGQADGDFFNNRGGGLVTFHDRTIKNFSITLNKVIFDDNYADLGGAWYTENISSATVHTTYFKNNRALYGGAVASRNGVNFKMYNVHFFNNRAQYEGGALFADGGTKAELHKTLFTNNTAGKNGGAIELASESGKNQETKMQVIDTLFSGNRAELFGGAVEGNGASKLIVSLSHFHDNFAKKGGDIATRGQARLTLDNCVFIDEEGQQLFKAPQKK
ncbi:hypothetical protein JWG39_02715 [Desulforhopalus vacuolatus]|uniref:hypothetical protein n=1 Tax=Desulforhopalus vacuolatus TaxID=40414 RepID=UPI001966AD4B|nr:hypothetical protein [Desulforhopalus vacuolatus]MBM9518730.1 hypothetical protein [Desulforhopalus vacuolatus]